MGGGCGLAGPPTWVLKSQVSTGSALSKGHPTPPALGIQETLQFSENLGLGVQAGCVEAPQRASPLALGYGAGQVGNIIYCPL